MKIEITDKLDSASKTLLDLTVKSEDTRILQIVREELRDDVTSNFEGEHDPYGKAWKPNTAYTKKKKGKDKKILEDSGDLFNEMSSLDNYIINGSKLDVITTVIEEERDGITFYGEVHDKGLNGLAKREIVAYTDKIHKKVDKRVNDLFK